jgi:hypothetical protein
MRICTVHTSSLAAAAADAAAAAAAIAVAPRRASAERRGRPSSRRNDDDRGGGEEETGENAKPARAAGSRSRSHRALPPRACRSLMSPLILVLAPVGGSINLMEFIIIMIMSRVLLA